MRSSRRKPKRKRADPECEIRVHSPGFRRKLEGKPARRYRLRLYVAGTNLNSFAAIQNLRQLCDTVLPGRVELEIVDLYQQPELATRDHIVAAPALVKLLPLPQRIFIGDMSDAGRVLAGLGIRVSDKPDGPGLKTA